MQTWLRLGHNRETCIADWADKGVPLGINAEIPSCGIFPPGGEHLRATSFGGEEMADLLMQPGENYASCKEHPEDTEIEVQRNIKNRNCRLMERDEAAEMFPRGNISKLGIILGETAEGEAQDRG